MPTDSSEEANFLSSTASGPVPGPHPAGRASTSNGNRLSHGQPRHRNHGRMNISLESACEIWRVACGVWRASPTDRSATCDALRSAADCRPQSRVVPSAGNAAENRLLASAVSSAIFSHGRTHRWTEQRRLRLCRSWMDEPRRHARALPTQPPRRAPGAVSTSPSPVEIHRVADGVSGIAFAFPTQAQGLSIRAFNDLADLCCHLARQCP